MITPFVAPAEKYFLNELESGGLEQLHLSFCTFFFGKTSGWTEQADLSNGTDMIERKEFNIDYIFNEKVKL